MKIAAPRNGGGIMSALVLVKKYVALLGLRNTIGIIVAALLVAAVTGWANPNASSHANIGGHYNLQPIW
jgi:hypothetical protein